LDAQILEVKKRKPAHLGKAGSVLADSPVLSGHVIHQSLQDIHIT